MKKGSDQISSITKETYPFADVTKASDDSDLSGEHDIGGTLDTVNEGFTAAIVVVELGLGDRVIDVDGGDLQLSVTERLVQVVNTRGGLLRDTANVSKVLRVLLVDHVGKVASVIEDHVEGFSTREGSEGLLDAPGVLFLSLAFPGIDRNTSGRDSCSSMVLRGEDVLK